MDNGEKELINFVRIAYKKLKASVYYDKTLLPLRDKIVDFEDGEIENKLSSLALALFAKDDKTWNALETEILNGIKVLTFPKKLEPISDETVIFNEPSDIKLKTPQYFIDLPVVGQIVGTLWVLSIGMALDTREDHNGMYEHSYGNRLRSKLSDENSLDLTYSTGLFESYFGQYSTWRDKGLKRAKECLENKQDAMVLTLDFKNFYYSVELNENNFKTFISKFEEYRNCKSCYPWHKRVNERINGFVLKVLEAYSTKLKITNNNNDDDGKNDLKIESLRLLPIGFLPSPILANWVLTAFDNAVIERWNPVYYGRYVDDILIVDKVVLCKI